MTEKSRESPNKPHNTHFLVFVITEAIFRLEANLQTVQVWQLRMRSVIGVSG